jgi:hypothetical protein
VAQLSPLSVPLGISQEALELELLRIAFLVNKVSIVRALLLAYNVLQVLTAQSSQLARHLLQTQASTHLLATPPQFLVHLVHSKQPRVKDLAQHVLLEVNVQQRA